MIRDEGHVSSANWAFEYLPLSSVYSSLLPVFDFLKIGLILYILLICKGSLYILDVRCQIYIFINVFLQSVVGLYIFFFLNHFIKVWLVYKKL